MIHSLELLQHHLLPKKLGRCSIGIELQEDYIKIGLRRLGLQDKYNGKKLIKEIKNYKHNFMNHNKNISA